VSALVSRLLGTLKFASVTLRGRGGTHACPACEKGLELMSFSSSRIDTALTALSQILVSIMTGAVITQNPYLLGPLMSASVTLYGKSSAHACIARNKEPVIRSSTVIENYIVRKLYLLGLLMSASVTVHGRSSEHACIAVEKEPVIRSSAIIAQDIVRKFHL